MDVAYIHPDYPGSEGTGATHSATQVVRGLRERGHTVTVYCTSTVPDHVLAENDRLVDLEINPHFPRHFGEELIKSLEERRDELEEFDVVHSYLMQALSAVGRLSRETRVETTITLNAYLAVCPKNDLRYMGSEQCTSNGTIKCTKCLTDSTARHARCYNEPAYEKIARIPHRWTNSLRRLRLVNRGLKYKNDVAAYRAPSTHVKWNHTDFGFDGDRIRVIPHPVDDAFRVDHKSNFSEPYQLLYVGALEEHKGVDRLVPIVDHLRNNFGAKFELTIVGSGLRRSQLERQIRKRSLAESIDLRGFVPYEELPELYARSDLFVFPVRWDEPFARVYLEALATGTPIVTTDFGEIETLLGDACARTDGTPEDFSQTISSLVSDRSLHEMSRSASARATAFNLKDVIVEIERMYESILA